MLRGRRCRWPRCSYNIVFIFILFYSNLIQLSFAKSVKIGDLHLDIPDNIEFETQQSKIDVYDRSISIKISSIWPYSRRPAVDVLTISSRKDAISLDFWCKARAGALTDLKQGPLRYSEPFSVFRSLAPGGSDIYVALNGPHFLSVPLVVVLEKGDFFDVRGNNHGKHMSFMRAITSYVTIESRIIESTIDVNQIGEFINALENHLVKWTNARELGAECKK